MEQTRQRYVDRTKPETEIMCLSTCPIKVGRQRRLRGLRRAFQDRSRQYDRLGRFCGINRSLCGEDTLSSRSLISPREAAGQTAGLTLETAWCSRNSTG